MTRTISATQHRFGALLGAMAAGSPALARHTGGSHAWAAAHGFPEIAAAMRSDRQASGGAWVPEHMHQEVIELLRPRSAFRALNPTTVPLVGGGAVIRKITGGATASYKGEAQSGTTSEGTSGQVNLVAKSLMAFVPITFQLVRSGGVEIMEADGVEALATRSDLAFIRGDGLQNTPRGLRNLAPAANVSAANAVVNLANVTADLGLLVLALENADVRMIRPGWMFAPRTRQYLMTVRDGNGNFAFRDEMLTGKLQGYPYAVTSQIPTNLGVGGDESEVYLADFADVLLGEEERLRVDVFDQATYWDGVQWVSAAQNDEVVLRLVAEHDVGLRHDESVAVLTGVTWTP